MHFFTKHLLWLTLAGVIPCVKPNDISRIYRKNGIFGTSFLYYYPWSDWYAMHVSADMTACPWKLNHDDHHVYCFYNCHTHTRFPRHRSNPRHDVPRRAPHPSRPHRSSAFVCMTCRLAELRRPSTFYHRHTRLDAVRFLLDLFMRYPDGTAPPIKEGNIKIMDYFFEYVGKVRS